MLWRASATATDGNGVVIENNGLTESDEMTIAGYSDSSYSKELRCALDSLPAYCSGSPVTLSGLPPGEHVFTMVESINDQITVQYLRLGHIGVTGSTSKQACKKANIEEARTTLLLQISLFSSQW